MSKSRSYLACIGLSLATLAGLPMSSAVAAEDENAYLLEEVVVTAQKREESLAEIPMSITVLGGSMLEQDLVFNFKDLVPLVPGLSVTGDTPGETRITLRGINTGGVATTVGVYLGDVPFGSSSGLANASVLSGEFDTFDLARIEVLRGPQGTLYGASSLGGVFKYVPNLPSTEGFEARARAGLETVKHGDLGWAFTGVLNTPVSDTFALRFSGYYRSDGGFVDSIGDNPIPALLPPFDPVVDGTQVKSDLDSNDVYGGRIQALWAPSDDFSLNLMALLQDIDSDDPTQVDGDPVTFKPLYKDPVQSRYQDEYSDITYRLYSATLDWDFGPASLQSITGYSEFEQDFQVDAALAIPLTQGPPLASLLSYLFGMDLSAVLPELITTDKWTQEFRVISDDSDTLEWLVGAFYTHEDSLLNQKIYAVDSGTETRNALLPVLADLSLTSKYKELAAFANATWYITPAFQLGFGGRISHNEQDLQQTSTGPLAGEALFTADSSESPFTWSVAPRYQLSEQSSLYARIATGFRPGGPNIVPPGAPPGYPSSYDSDSLTSYEAGYKGTSADGLFAVDFTAYYLDWKDIQILTEFLDYNINGNAGKASSKGFEFSGSVVPTEGLDFTLNAAYTNAKLTEDTAAAFGGLDGDHLPYVPKWSFGLMGTYEWAVGSGSTAYVGGTLGYTGKRPYSFNDRESDGSLVKIPGFTTVDLRAGIEAGRWAFEVYAKNLFDELGITSVGTANTPYSGYVDMGIIRPQAFGFTVTASY